MEPHLYWMGFNLVKGIGAVRVQGLLRAFGDLKRAWHASQGELEAVGLSAKVARSVVETRQRVNLEQLWENLTERGIKILITDDEDYPMRLKEVDQPPPVLYVRGEIKMEDALAVAIVGTRKVTAYGRQVTEELAACLAHNGVTVVSGLARGVDATAHQAALKAGGRTIGVLGSGVDQIYPPEHLNLAKQMTGAGAVISDYAPGTPPEAVNFPPRNRIISGLSLAVVVVEAGETSGALITASFAAEQGRDVLAVPGGIYTPLCKGTNRLISQGARPLLAVEEVLEVINVVRQSQQVEARQILPADPTEARLLQILELEPIHIDEICGQSGLPIETVSATLTMMELKGLVRQEGSMTYVAAHEARAQYGVD